MGQHQEQPRLRRAQQQRGYFASTLHYESQLFKRGHFEAILAEHPKRNADPKEKDCSV
jgi:hypothetical protein